MVSGEWRVDEPSPVAAKSTEIEFAQADRVDFHSKLTTHDSPLTLTAELFPSGLNGALRRWPNVNGCHLICQKPKKSW